MRSRIYFLVHPHGQILRRKRGPRKRSSAPLKDVGFPQPTGVILIMIGIILLSLCVTFQEIPDGIYLTINAKMIQFLYI